MNRRIDTKEDRAIMTITNHISLTSYMALYDVFGLKEKRIRKYFECMQKLKEDWRDHQVPTAGMIKYCEQKKIHVYDWMLYSDVIDYIKNYNNPVTYDLNSDVVFLSYNKRNIDIMSSLGYVVDSVVPQAHYYNMRTREHYMISPTDMKGFVVVYDEGQIKFIKKVINNF